MQTKNEPKPTNENKSGAELEKNNSKNKISNEANKPILNEEEVNFNKNQVGNKNFIETIFKKTLPNSNLINKENLKLFLEKNKLLENQKEEECNNPNNNNNFQQEIKSHRQSNNGINIGNVSNKEMVLATKEINKRKISNSFILEKSESPKKSKDKINKDYKSKNIKEMGDKININNKNLLNVNISKNNANLNPNNENIKNIQINFRKTSSNFNLKNSEINNLKGTNEINNNKPVNNYNNNNNYNINNKNYMDIIEQKLHFKNAKNKDKNINKSNQTSRDENLIEKNSNNKKSLEKEKTSRSNSKNKNKTKFKSNKKLENHLGYATKTFINNKNLNQKIEVASSSSGFSNFFANKNKGHTNTKSDFDIAKNSNVNINFNLTLKNNEHVGKTIRILDNDKSNFAKNKLNSQQQLLEKLANNDIDDYYKNIVSGNKENDECNIIKTSSVLINGKNRTSMNLGITEKKDKLGSNDHILNLKQKNLEMQKHLSQEKIIKSENKNNDNILKSLLNNESARRRNKFSQRISINSNRNIGNNSFDNANKIAKIEEKIISQNRIFSANSRLEKDFNKENLYNYFDANDIEENMKTTNIENLIFNNFKRNSNNLIIVNNQSGVLKNKLSASDKSNNILISNSLSVFGNNNFINNKNSEDKKKISNVNENIFLEKIKQKKENNEASEDLKTSAIEKKSKKNLNSTTSTGFANNSNSNLKFNENNMQVTNWKIDKRISSPIGKIDTKKLKIMIINKETSKNSDLKNPNKDSNKLNILGTNSNFNEATEEGNTNAGNFNLAEMKNIKIEGISKNSEINKSNYNHNQNNKSKSNNQNNNKGNSNVISSNINKTYSTLAKKIKKSKEAKQILEFSSNSNFEIISCKADRKSEEENAIVNKNKSYDISKNLSNKTKENSSNSKNLQFEKLIQKSKSNSNSNKEDNLNNYCKAVIINNFSLENELNKEEDEENLNLISGSNKKNRKNFISKNNLLFNSVNEANFNTKTTKDTLKLSYYQNKNFSHIEIEGPEELHMLYINLNQQNKKLIYKFEKMDYTIKADKDNTCTVYHYDNEVEI